jgi:conjugal transfer/entry exclusion protein
MNPLNKIQSLLDQKRKVEKDIEKIQSKCSHKVKHIKFVFLNQHSQQTSTRWVCDDCQKTLHIPTEFEIKKFLNK